MNAPDIRTCLVLAGLLAGMSASGPEAKGEEEAVAARTLRADIVRLLADDAARAAAKNLPTPSPPASEAGVVQLVPLVVKGLPERRIKPISETRVEKFVRTGVLWQSSGPNPRARLWMKGDRGLMISFGF